jgi:type IV pilus assembly protein PilA
MRLARGFTLIELLIVIVIIGILAAMAILNYANSRERAQLAGMKADLRNLATAEEAYFYDSAAYTTSLPLMNNYTPSKSNTVVVNEATKVGWSATATNLNTAKKCYVFMGTATPIGTATMEGVASCS